MTSAKRRQSLKNRVTVTPESVKKQLQAAVLKVKRSMPPKIVVAAHRPKLDSLTKKGSDVIVDRKGEIRIRRASQRSERVGTERSEEIMTDKFAQTHAPEGIDQKEQGADPWIGPLQQRRREIMAIPHGMACGGTCSTCEELRRIDVALKTIADYQPLDGESAALLIERENKER